MTRKTHQEICEIQETALVAYRELGNRKGMPEPLFVHQTWEWTARIPAYFPQFKQDSDFCSKDCTDRFNKGMECPKQFGRPQNLEQQYLSKWESKGLCNTERSLPAIQNHIGKLVIFWSKRSCSLRLACFPVIP